MKTQKLILLAILIAISQQIIGQSLNLNNNLKIRKDLFKNKLDIKNSSDTILKTKLLLKAGFEPTEKVDTNNDLSSISGLGDISFSSAIVIPNVKILGDITTNSLFNKDIYGSVCLYGLQKISENSVKDNSVSMLIKEPSFWGLGLQGATFLTNSLDVNNFFKFGINLNIDYTSRKISTLINDSLSAKYIEPSSIIVKLGGEAIIYNRASIYFDYNYTEVLSGIDDFKAYFNTSTTKFNFWDIGFRFILTTPNINTKNTSPKIFIDLSFIIINNDIKNFTTNDDKVIPMLRLNFTHPILSN